MSGSVDQLFDAAGQQYNVDPNLLRAVFHAESNGDWNATSPAGARGGMQLMPATAKALGVTDPTNPQQAIPAAAELLSQNLATFGTPERALMAYNAGTDPSKWNNPETQAYVPRVAAAYSALRAPSGNYQVAASNGGTQTDALPNPSAPPSYAGMSSADFLKATAGTAPAGSAPPSYGSMSNADFLQATTGTAPAPAGATATPAPSYAGMNSQDFLTATTGAPASVPAAPAPAPVTPQNFVPPDYTAGQIPVGMSVPNAAPVQTLPNPASRTGSAMVQGFENGFGAGPLGMSPQTTAALQRAGVLPSATAGGPLRALNAAVLDPLFAAGDLVARTAGGLFGAYQGGVSQAGAEAGAPILGRDLAALPEAFAGSPDMMAPPRPGNALAADALPAATANPLAARPPMGRVVGDAGTGTNAYAFVPPGSRFPTAPVAEAAPAEAPAFLPPGATAPVTPNPLLPASRYLTPEGAATPNPLAATTTTPAQWAAETNGAVAAPDVSFGPQSAGAAATIPGSAVEMSPAQVQAYRSTAEGQKLLEPQPAGTADRNAYVPGVVPNSAEIEQNVNTARELKSLNVTAPAVSAEAKQVAAENNEQRQLYLQGIAGSPVDVANAVAARDAQAATDRAAVFDNAAPVDAQPIANAAQNILNDPQLKERSIIQKTIAPVLNQLYDGGGDLKSDPRSLYGIRQNIDDMLSKQGQAETPTAALAQSQLLQVKSAIDGAIQKTNPGWQTYLDNYSAASKPIDAMQVLQDHEPKLYDAQNRMTYNKVQTMMRQVVDSRQAPGINPYKSIPDDTMQQLWNLRDDLRRSASAQELARTAGSDSVQNAWDVAKGVLGGGANLLAHGVILSHTGPVGNVLFNGLKSAVTSGATARTAAKQTARGMKLLHPDPSTLRNPLQQP